MRRKGIKLPTKRVRRGVAEGRARLRGYIGLHGGDGAIERQLSCEGDLPHTEVSVTVLEPSRERLRVPALYGGGRSLKGTTVCDRRPMDLIHSSGAVATSCPGTAACAGKGMWVGTGIVAL